MCPGLRQDAWERWRVVWTRVERVLTIRVEREGPGMFANTHFRRKKFWTRIPAGNIVRSKLTPNTKDIFGLVLCNKPCLMLIPDLCAVLTGCFQISSSQASIRARWSLS